MSRWFWAVWGAVAGVVSVSVAMGMFGAQVAVAAQPGGLMVANANACFSCHAVDRKLIGPSFLQVAAKYKGDKDAAKKLQAKVRDGGAGVWGMIPMPAHPGMSNADVASVVDWVLEGAPQR